MGKRVLSALALAFAAITSSTHIASASSHFDAPVGSRRSVAEEAPWNKQQYVSSLRKGFDLPITRGGAIDAPNELLGGCLLLFAFLLLADFFKGGFGNDMFAFLSPGAGLLAKWLPVFFVPGLAMLPRAPSLGSALDIFKILSIVVVGFFYTLSSVIFAVSFVGRDKPPEKSAGKAVKKMKVAVAPPAKPYSQETLNALIKGSILSGAISIAATRSGNGLSTPFQTVFFVLSTLASFVFGARLPSDFTKVVHPLLTATAMVWAIVHLVAKLTGSNFMNVLASYKVGSMGWKSTGAGDIFLYILGPSVVSFGISMYSRKQLLKDNIAVVGMASIVSSCGGLFGTAALARLLSISGKMVRLSIIPRNITTALAMAIASILGGDISIAASAVVLTGIIGATCGRSIMDAMGVKEPITRGLGLGAAAQGLGVSALVPEPDAFPFAAMSMVLTAVVSTSLVSIPAVKDLVVNIATGDL